MAKEIQRTSIGAKIRERRKEMHITQVEISKMLGIKRNTYARYETDTTPPLAILTKLGQIFGMTTDEILSAELTYSEIINETRKKLLKMSTEHGYKTPNNQSFTKEELDILVKIMDLPKDKRDELIGYISEIVDENETSDN